MLGLVHFGSYYKVYLYYALCISCFDGSVGVFDKFNPLPDDKL